MAWLRVEMIDWKGVDFRLAVGALSAERDESEVRRDEGVDRPLAGSDVKPEGVERGGELDSEVRREVKSEDASASPASPTRSLAPASGTTLSSSFSLSSLLSSFATAYTPRRVLRSLRLRAGCSPASLSESLEVEESESESESEEELGVSSWTGA